MNSLKAKAIILVATLVFPSKYMLSQERRNNHIDSIQIKTIDRAKAIEKTAYTVTSIQTANLKNTNTDAKDVLNKVSGVRIMQDGGLGSGISFTLNGFSGQQVKIFLDGMPIEGYSSSFGLNTIPINSVERMDVYKGVVPVELGTDALGGVVNIITNKKKNYLDLSYSYGSFNTHRSSVNGAITNDKGWAARGSVNYNYSDNNYKVYVPIVRNNIEQYYDNVPRFHDRYRSVMANVETGIVGKPFADKLLLGINASADDKQIQHGTTMSKVYGGITNDSQTIAPNIKYSKKNIFLDGLDANLFASYNFSKTNVLDALQGVTYNWLGEKEIDHSSNAGEFFRTNTTLKDKELHTGINLSYKVHKEHTLGINYIFTNFGRSVYDAFNPNNVSNQFAKSLSKGVFGLSYNTDISKIFSITAFSKFYSLNIQGEKQYDFAMATQRTEKFKNQNSNVGYGAATTILPFDNFQIKASYEKAYRMPNVEELFGDGLFIQTNIDLQPEKSDNLNLGLSYNHTIAKEHNIYWVASLLYRNAYDLIYRIATVSSPITRYGNLSKTKTIGVEGSIGYRWKKLYIDANATFQNITDRADYVYVSSYTGGGRQTNYQKGLRIPNIPYLFWNANAGYTIDNFLNKEAKLNLNYRFNYVHEYYLTWAELGSKDSKKVIPTQLSHDLEFIYSLKKNKYNIALEIRNITNEKLYDRFYLQKPGRAFFVKLRYTL